MKTIEKTLTAIGYYRFFEWLENKLINIRADLTFYEFYLLALKEKKDQKKEGGDRK